MTQAAWVKFKKEAEARGWRIKEHAAEVGWLLTATLGLVVLDTKAEELIRARELLLMQVRGFQRRR